MSQMNDEAAVRNVARTGPEEAVSSFDDPRVIQALEEYRAALDAGLKPDRRAFVARYPEIAEALAGCLAALDFVHSAAPGLSGPGHDPPEARSSADQVSGTLGDFRILREIGRGGMGVVYEAEQISLGRRVALKVLPFASTLDPRQLQRFKSEAHAAACLHHTNIVPVYATGCERSVHFYAMQFIDGQTLAAVIEGLREHAGLTAPQENEPTQSARSAVVHDLLTGQWLGSGKDKQAAPALGTAPYVGGASPPSEMPARDDDPTQPLRASVSSARSISGARSTRSAAFFRGVAHLGIQAALALEHAHEAGIVHRDIKPANLLVDASGNLWVTDFGLVQLNSQPGMTMTGDLVGTLRYMSPEQALAKRVLVDHRTDIYSLGATLYELLTLEPAVPGRDRQEILRRIAFEEPRRPGRINASIPPELETIVGKAMEKKPEERYGTAQELADDLRRYLDDQPIRAKRPTLWHRARKLARRHPGMAWMGAALLAVIAVGSSISTMLVVRQLARAEQAEADLQVEYKRAVQAEHTALEHLQKAERAERERSDQLWRAKVERARAGRFSGRAGRAFDGLQALAEAAQIARSLNVPDEAIVKIRNEAIACMALPDLRPIKEWSKYTPHGGDTREEYSDLQGDAGALLDPYAKRYTSSDETGSITVRRMADDQVVVRLNGPGVAVRAAAFSPDGQFLGATYPGRVLIWELARGRVAFRLTTGVQVPWLLWSPDGRRFAVYGQGGPVILCDVDSRRELTRFAINVPSPHVAFHPNSKQLAIANKPLQIRDVETGTLVTECDLPLPQYQMAWGAAGRFLALAPGDRGDPDTDHHVYVWDVLEGRMHKVLKGHTNTVLRVAFNHAGNLLASNSWDGTIRLWDPWSGEELVRDTEGHWGGTLEFSPDDRFLSLSVRWSRARQWWEIKAPRELRTFGTTAGRPFQRLEFSAEQRFLTSYDGATVAFWDVIAGTQIAACPCPFGGFCTENGALLAGGPLGLYRWPFCHTQDDLRSQLRIGPARRLTRGLHAPCQLSPDGRTLVALDEHSVLAVNLADPNSTRVLIPDRAGISDYALSPDGRWLATGAHHGDGAKVWDAHSGKLVRQLTTDSSAGVRFSPDGDWLVTVSDSYQFWRVGSWQSGPALPKAHIAGNMTFTEDSKLLAITRSIWEIQLIDVASGREVATLASPRPAWAGDLRFSPDGRLLAQAGRQGIGVWDLRAIHERLRELGLGWDQRAYPPARADATEDRPGLRRPVQVHLDWGDFSDGSIKSLLIAFFPWHAEAYYQRGLLNASLANRAGALADFDMAIALRPGHAQAHYHRGVIHARAGRYPQALADFNQTLALAPEQAEAHGERAWTFLGLMDVDQAIADFARALERRPDDWDLRFGLGKARAELQQWSEAAAAYAQAAALKPSFWPAWYLGAEACLNRGDWEGAVTGFSKALERQRSLVSVSRVLVFTLPARRPQLIQDPRAEITWGLPEAKARCRRGLAYAQLGQRDYADADFAQAAKVAPDLIDVPYTQALALLASGDLPGYRRVCARMLENFGQTNDAETAYRAAWIVTAVPEAVQDLQQVVKLAEKAVAADAKNGDYAVALGAALYRAGRYQEVVRRLQPAAGRPKPSAHGCLVLAMAHRRLGQYGEASQWLERAEKQMQSIADPAGKASPLCERLLLERLRREAAANGQ